MYKVFARAGIRNFNVVCDNSVPPRDTESKSFVKECVKMIEDDTIKLLRECNAGVKMGITSLDDVMDHVRDQNLKNLLIQSKETHSKLGSETHQYLMKCQDDGKEPGTMAKMMSWMKTNMKLGGEDSDRVVADLVTDGCNMGIKKLHKHLNQYDAANEPSRNICKRLIAIEDTLYRDMQAYL